MERYYYINEPEMESHAHRAASYANAKGRPGTALVHNKSFMRIFYLTEQYWVGIDFLLRTLFILTI